ncbi:hypothetical protein ACSBOB_19280 [Mesorhizobium sp. ASY16-5R]|uniref:hypothetical protein n=1 Tax=Mesorhizobium sp. ASY16-5R TaxID=3445772 RepID=UPI003F9FAD36
MSFKFQMIDKALLGSSFDKMGKPEKQLARTRAKEFAQAVASDKSLSSDFKRLAAYQLLEELGTLPVGSAIRGTIGEAE